jgi:pseudouridine synthase
MAVMVDGVLVYGPDTERAAEGAAQNDREYLPQVVVYHKPEGVVTSMSDELGRPDLSTVLPSRYAHMHPVGRLDLDTRGLLIFCSNGSLTKRLTSTKMSVEREYEALVDGEVDEAALGAKLQAGVEIKCGKVSGRVVHASCTESGNFHISRYDACLQPDPSFADCLHPVRSVGRSAKIKLPEGPTPQSVVRLEVFEGKNRMVRRMLDACGHPVRALCRVRHGELRLGSLASGEMREVTPAEQQWLRELLKAKYEV